MAHRTRLLIVDDQRLFAEGLKFVIESRAKDLNVVDTAENGRAAIQKIEEHRPDVVLMDVRMPVMDGVQATRIVHERFPEIKILILTTFDDDEYVKFSMQNGAVGYLLKNRPPEQLIDSIRALTRGTVQIDSAVVSKMIGTGSVGMPSGSDDFFARLRTLTIREQQVLRLLVEARSVSQIANSLEIAEQTVRNHTSNIYSKLGIHNRIEIVRMVDKIRFFLEHNPDASTSTKTLR